MRPVPGSVSTAPERNGTCPIRLLYHGPDPVGQRFMVRQQRGGQSGAKGKTWASVQGSQTVPVVGRLRNRAAEVPPVTRFPSPDRDKFRLRQDFNLQEVL